MLERGGKRLNLALVSSFSLAVPKCRIQLRTSELYREKNKQNEFTFISLGCDKNLVDTEKCWESSGKRAIPSWMMKMRRYRRCQYLLLYRRCKRREHQHDPLRMAELKKTGRLKALIVTGCLAQRYKQEIIDEIRR